MPYSRCKEVLERKHSVQVRSPDHWNGNLVCKGLTGHRMVLEMAFHAFLCSKYKVQFDLLKRRVLARSNYYCTVLLQIS